MKQTQELITINQNNLSLWINDITNAEGIFLMRLLPMIDKYNVIRHDEKILSLKDISDNLIDNLSYSGTRKLVEGLVIKNVLCKYYIETYDNVYTKAYILNPEYATKNNFNSKYVKIFKDHKLIEDNYALYNGSGSVNRTTPEYLNWVQSSLERDNYICQCCGSIDNLEVHHILNYASHKDLRTDLTNSITLCENCHANNIKGSFHNTYGTRNNTQEQLDDYIKGRKTQLV